MSFWSLTGQIPVHSHIEKSYADICTGFNGNDYFEQFIHPTVAINMKAQNSLEYHCIKICLKLLRLLFVLI